MDVLISWSGPKSEALALALHHWLPYFINMVKPWMSKLDMEMGIRWSPELTKKLEETKFGIICLTQENLDSPWVLFEAGALSKTKDTNVCPYLLDLKPSDIRGPLGQFQSAKANEDDTRKLIHSINHALGNEVLPEELINNSFDKFWPDLESSIKLISQKANKSLKPSLTVDDKIDEMLGTIRENSRILSEITSSLQKNKEFHPREVYEGPSISNNSNIEENKKLLAGNGGSISQGEKTAEIGDWIIQEYRMLGSKKASNKGKAILLRNEAFEPGHAIANLKIIDSVNQYRIQIIRTELNNGLTKVVFNDIREERSGL